MTMWRIILFLSIFFIMAVLEIMLPRRILGQKKAPRWFTNFSLVVIDSVLVRLILPVAAIGTASLMQERGQGLFYSLDWPLWLEGIIAFVALDFAIYVQHVASHKIPLFWRLHRVHHSDRDIDVTTALRFHPVEILLSMIFKMILIVLLGPPVMAVLVFEVVLNGGAMFNHANVKLPKWLDRVLRLVIVTPDMHRVHHSTLHVETDSNYGFNLSIWDRLWRTYTDQPRLGHDKMTIGLNQYQDERPNRLSEALLIPFDEDKPGKSD